MERRKFLFTAGANAVGCGIATMSRHGVAAGSLAAAPQEKSAAAVDVKIQSGSTSSRIRIRPAARGGKYLGHDAADRNNLSALVAIQHPGTGKIVAHGFAKAPTAQSAGPGDLMDPVGRNNPFASDEHSVDVQLDLAVTEPADFRVLVYGPLKHPDQAGLVQADIVVLPGVDIGMSAATPLGLVIEIPGLCIGNVTADWQGARLSCTAEVTMMCGCPIHDQPGWFWPDSDFSIQLVTFMQSGAQHFYPLGYDKAKGVASTFTGVWPSQAAPGDRVRQAWVYAIEPKLGNVGKFRIFPPRPTHAKLPEPLRDILRKYERSRPRSQAR